MALIAFVPVRSWFHQQPDGGQANEASALTIANLLLTTLLFWRVQVLSDDVMRLESKLEVRVVPASGS